MKKRANKAWGRMALLPAAAIGGAALAQQAPEQAPEQAPAPMVVAATDATGLITLPTVVATADAGGSLTVPGITQQKRNLFQTAGSVGFVDAASYEDTYAFNLHDVLRDAPGVYVEERYGQELRLSVRGSGVARGFHTRGIEILQDGVPTNFADGSGDFYQIDPLGLQAAEVYKGGNGLSWGSTTLGGAMNFTTPTAYTAESPNAVRVDGGSFGTARVAGQVSRQMGDLDFLGNLSISHSDGYRDHSRGQYEQFNGNVGYRISPTVETRTYFGAYIVDQLLPGTLSLQDALNNPRKASATALSGDQARDTRTFRLANVTTFKVDGGQVDLTTWAIHKDLYHPIFQVIDQDYWTYGIAPRYTGQQTIGGMRNEVIAGARFFGGNNDARQYVNVNGNRGAQTLNSRQDAYNWEAFVEDRLYVMPTVAIMAGAKAYLDQRKYTDYGGLPTNPTPKSDSKDYTGVNPKLGVLWEPRKNVQVFADITRSADVPDFTDLNQTISSSQQFVPLSAQHAWTLEVGTRGRHDIFGWDLTLYRSMVRDQLLQFTVTPDVPAATFNANRTTLQGVEFGGSADVLHDLITKGDRVTVSQIWNYSDFRFDNDPQFGNNRIPGVPQHVLRTTVAYGQPIGLRVAATIDWVPTGAWVDYANTLKVPSYVLFGLQASYAFERGVTLYFDARNLADKRYISDFSTIVNASAPGANTAVFYPGTGRAFYAGMRYNF